MVFVLPIVWMVTTSFQAGEKMFQLTTEWIPSVWHPENYPNAMGRAAFPLFFRNSVPESVPDAHPLAKVDDLLKHDVVYVGGGNTANLLALWRLHGVDRVLSRAFDSSSTFRKA